MGGLLGILTIVDPPIALQSVPSGAAGHELPDAAGAYPRERQRVKARLRLREINQILRDALLFQDAANHVFIAARPDQRVFQRATPTTGEVRDISGDLIGHHQGQIRTGGFDFRFGLGFYVRVYRDGSFVRFVDGRGFRLLLGEAVSLLQGLHVEAVDAFDDAIKFVFQARIGVDFQIAAQEQIEGAIKVLTGGIKMTGFVVVLASSVFLFNFCNEVRDRICGRRGCRCLRPGLRR